MAGSDDIVLILAGVVVLALICAAVLSFLYWQRNAPQRYNMSLYRYTHQVNFSIRSIPDLKGHETTRMIRPGDVIRICREYSGSDGQKYLKIGEHESGWVAEQVPGIGPVCMQIPISSAEDVDSAMECPVTEWEYFRESGWAKFDTETSGLLSRAKAKDLAAVQLPARKRDPSASSKSMGGLMNGGSSERLVVDLVSMQQISMGTGQRSGVRRL